MVRIPRESGQISLTLYSSIDFPVGCRQRSWIVLGGPFPGVSHADSKACHLGPKTEEVPLKGQQPQRGSVCDACCPISPWGRWPQPRGEETKLWKTFHFFAGKDSSNLIPPDLLQAWQDLDQEGVTCKPGSPEVASEKEEMLGYSGKKLGSLEENEV